MNPLTRVYRAVVPRGVRGWVAGVRHHAGVYLTDPQRRREAAADLWERTRLPVRPTRTPFGTLFVDVRDRFVGRPIYVHRTYHEPAEIAFLQSHLRPGMTYLDIGANLGFMVAVAVPRVGPGGRVIAVEPDPTNYRLLTRAVRTNGWRQVTAVNAAAGEAPGTARLFKSARNFGDHRLYADGEAAGRRAVTVPVVRLDDLFAEKGFPPPDVVKVDVQGYEWFVARGMDRLLGGDRPLAVLSEFWPHGITNAGGDPRGYLDLFRTRGFGCFRPRESGELTPVGWDAVWGLIPPFDPAHPDSAMTNLVFLRPAAGG